MVRWLQGEQDGGLRLRPGSALEPTTEHGVDERGDPGLIAVTVVSPRKVVERHQQLPSLVLNAAPIGLIIEAERHAPPRQLPLKKDRYGLGPRQASTSWRKDR